MWGVCPGCGCGRDTVVVSHAGELVVMACLWCGSVWPATVPVVDAEALLARFSGGSGTRLRGGGHLSQPWARGPSLSTRPPRFTT